MDQLSVEQSGRRIAIYTHGSKVKFFAAFGPNSNGDDVTREFTFNQLFEMISKLEEEKEIL